MRKQHNLRVFIFYAVLIVVLIGVVSVLFNNGVEKTTTDSEIVALFRDNKVKSFTVEAEGELTIVTTDKGTIKKELQDISAFREAIEPYLYQEGSAVESYDYKPVENWPWWVSLAWSTTSASPCSSPSTAAVS